MKSIKESLSDISAVILAGGFGTRLKQVVPDVPKSLAVVRGRPFLDYLLNSLKSFGLRKVVLCLGYGGINIEKWVGTGGQWGLDLQCSIESTPLGTAGAVKLAENLIHSSTVLVMNGDSYFRIDLRNLVDFHLKSGGLATIALASVSDVSRYGSVVLEDSGLVSKFLEKNESKTDSGIISAGIYCFKREVLDLIPADRPVSMEREILPILTKRGLWGFVSSSYFIDIGVPEDYLRAQTEFQHN